MCWNKLYKNLSIQGLISALINKHMFDKLKNISNEGRIKENQ